MENFVECVSIIVPVYKAESTIRRCIDSILSQTYQNFELILVDDGSPDNSGAICDEYAQSDIRVKVFHKENGGVSSARNLGIDKASGKYLVFVDSDDYVELDYLLHMMQVVSPSSELVIGGISRNKGESHEYWEPDGNRVVISKDLHTEWYSTKGFFYWYTYAKLFSLDIIKKYQLRFNEKLFYSEDFCFIMDYMAKIDSFELLKVHDYVFYVDVNESRSKKYKMNAEELIVHYDVNESCFIKLEQLCNDGFLNVRSNVYRRLFNCFLTFLLLNRYDIPTNVKTVKSWSHRKSFFEIVFESNWSKKRLIFYLMFYMPRLAVFIVKPFLKRIR